MGGPAHLTVWILFGLGAVLYAGVKRANDWLAGRR